MTLSLTAPPRESTPSLTQLGKHILLMAWPVLVAQLASISMMIADTLIVGHYSTTELAGVAVGAGIYITIALGLAGVIQAMGPIIGHHHGAGAHDQIGPDIRQGLWLVVLLSVIGMIPLLAFPHALLAPARLSPEVEAIAATYLRILAFSLPASLGYRAFHATTNALGYPRPLMYIAFVETLCHIGLAWLLVGGLSFGNKPVLPPLGAAGAATSQLVVTWGAFAASLWLFLHDKAFVRYAVLRHFELPQKRPQLALLRLGVPMGFSYLVEMSAFTLMALFIARLGPEIVSGHRIAANLSALTYMLPLSLAIATAAQVAQAAGAGKEQQAWDTARAGMLLSMVLSVLAGLLLWWLRMPIAQLATKDIAVAQVAAALTVYIAVYQFFDAAQTVAAFALRAYKVSFVPLLIHLFCFSGLGLGLGYWLAFAAPTPQGAAGFWQAAVIATVAACLLLGGLLIWVVRQRMRR